MTYTIKSTVRGGGCGKGAWVAKITNTHPKFKFERSFINPSEKNLSGSGKSGTITWVIDTAGIYEYRGIQLPKGEATIGTLKSGFIKINKLGEVTELDASQVEHLFTAGYVLAWLMLANI